MPMIRIFTKTNIRNNANFRHGLLRPINHSVQQPALRQRITPHCIFIM